MKSVKKAQIVEALKQVMDPELGLDLYTLGLIYRIDCDPENNIEVTMTYTTPFCPFGSSLRSQVETSLRALPAKTVTVHVTFDPPWEPTEEIREQLKG